MSQINPDPHTGGYVFEPTLRVTAFFPSGTKPAAVEKQLVEAGFPTADFSFFQGQEGLDKLDLNGEKHGLLIQIRRFLEHAISDDATILDRAEEVLKSGGMLAEVFVGEDESKKELAAKALKAQGGSEVWYWGELETERL